jgi:hypothetical protein
MKRYRAVVPAAAQRPLLFLDVDGPSSRSERLSIRRMNRPVVTARVNLFEAGFFGNHCVVLVSSLGSLIHTAVSSAGGWGGLRTNRSGCSA